MSLQEILQRRQVIHSDPEIMSGMPVFVGTRVLIQPFFAF